MLKRQVSGISLIDSNRPFAPLSVALLTTVIVLFAVGVRYPDLAAEDASGGATGTLGHSAREAAPTFAWVLRRLSGALLPPATLSATQLQSSASFRGEQRQRSPAGRCRPTSTPLGCYVTGWWSLALRACTAAAPLQ